jgi:hypothetical protein
MPSLPMVTWVATAGEESMLFPVAKLQAMSIPETFEGDSTFSVLL